MSNSIFKYPALIGYMIERMSKEYPSKQIGKTIVQKIFYLLTHEGIVNFNYSMYHYGPYSSGLSGELNFAESTGIVDIKWVEDKGYFIYPTEKLKHFERRMIDMNTLIKETAREAVKGIKAVSDEATNSLRKKNNRLFEVILLLIVIGFNVFIVLNK